jgi:hypothetical protein
MSLLKNSQWVRGILPWAACWAGLLRSDVPRVGPLGQISGAWPFSFSSVSKLFFFFLHCNIVNSK